jgi:hypothetical protein
MIALCNALFFITAMQGDALKHCTGKAFSVLSSFVRIKISYAIRLKALTIADFSQTAKF